MIKLWSTCEIIKQANERLQILKIYILKRKDGNYEAWRKIKEGGRERLRPDI